jgi:hypothetical protein
LYNKRLRTWVRLDRPARCRRDFRVEEMFRSSRKSPGHRAPRLQTILTPRACLRYIGMICLVTACVAAACSASGVRLMTHIGSVAVDKLDWASRDVRPVPRQAVRRLPASQRRGLRVARSSESNCGTCRPKNTVYTTIDRPPGPPRIQHLPIHASASLNNVSAMSPPDSTTPRRPFHPHVRFSCTFILGEMASPWSIPPCIRSWMAFSNPSIRVDMSFTTQANMSAARHERSVGLEGEEGRSDWTKEGRGPTATPAECQRDTPDISASASSTRA